MEAKSGEAVKHYWTDPTGRKFEVPVDPQYLGFQQFDFTEPDAKQTAFIYCDWLADKGLVDQAELMLLDWNHRFGNLKPNDDSLARVKELREQFGIKDVRSLTNKNVDGTRNRKQTITLLLEQPLGFFYTKATINVLHLEHFQKEIDDQPIVYMLLAFNGTTDVTNGVKYLGYSKYQKIETWEMNNWDLSFTDLRTVFMSTKVKPKHLLITGRVKNLPTKEQLKLLKEVCPGFRHLETIDYHGAKYDYRFAEDNQPK